MKKISFIIAIAAIVFLLMVSTLIFAGGAVEPLEQADRPTWKVGDTWIYQVTAPGKKSIMKAVVVKSDEKGYSVSMDNDGEKTMDFYNLDINFVRTTSEKGWQVESCEPEIPSFKWPLKQGKLWSGQYFFQDNKTSGGYLINMTTEVIGPETLIVEGKEVATLKLVSKRESGSGKGRKYSGKREFWYDPLTKFVIKRIDERSRGREERTLVSFTPGEGKK